LDARAAPAVATTGAVDVSVREERLAQEIFQLKQDVQSVVAQQRQLDSRTSAELDERFSQLELDSQSGKDHLLQLGGNIRNVRLELGQLGDTVQANDKSNTEARRQIESRMSDLSKAVQEYTMKQYSHPDIDSRFEGLRTEISQTFGRLPEVLDLDARVSGLSQAIQRQAIQVNTNSDSTTEIHRGLEALHNEVFRRLPEVMNKIQESIDAQQRMPAPVPADDPSSGTVLHRRCERLELSEKMRGELLLRLEKEMERLQQHAAFIDQSGPKADGNLLHRLSEVEAIATEARRQGREAIERSSKRTANMEDWLRNYVNEHGDTERRVHELEKKLQVGLRGVEEPVEEALSQLVTGMCKMAQLLGVAAEDSSDKLGWREACADLPRMMDHAWLRSRLPKRASILKILRQKADAETVREIQAQLESLGETVVAEQRTRWPADSAVLQRKYPTSSSAALQQQHHQHLASTTSDARAAAAAGIQQQQQAESRQPTAPAGRRASPGPSSFRGASPGRLSARGRGMYYRGTPDLNYTAWGDPDAGWSEPGM
jgi:predicted  nucleic acid-binding Zn-ribbon protein